MAIEERYARYIDELRTKLWPRLNEWEKSFVQSVANKPLLSAKQKDKLQKLLDERTQADSSDNQPRAREPLPTEMKSENGTIYANYDRDGWQFYLHGQVVGPRLTYGDARIVMTWFETALHDLGKAIDNVPLGEGPEARHLETSEPVAADMETDNDEAPF